MQIKIDLLKELREKGRIETTNIFFTQVFAKDRALYNCLYNSRNKEIADLNVLVVAVKNKDD